MHSVRDSRWRKIECSAVGAIDFMIMVSGFHDFRIKTISYDAERDRCEIFLQYDTGTDGIIMRFSNIYHMGYTPMCGLVDYDIDWIFSSDMEWNDSEKKFIWYSNYDFKKNEEYKQGATWIEADYLEFAYCDGEGNICDMPECFNRKCTCVSAPVNSDFVEGKVYSWKALENGKRVYLDEKKYHDFNNVNFTLYFTSNEVHNGDVRGVF